MALTAQYLIDTSAAARIGHPTVARVVRPLLEAGLVGTTPVLDAEAFFSARSPNEFARMRDNRRVAYSYVPLNDQHWQAALDAQFRLALSGRHRSVGIADLLTATLAEANRLTVVHYDSNFDTAATVLDFKHRWVATPGTL